MTPKKQFHLAQVNIARMRAPLDDPIMAGFVAQLGPVNAVADSSPGFVWRLQTSEGDATSLRPMDDPMVLFNMSVWESVDELKAYVYRSQHGRSLGDRKQWFEKPVGVTNAMWWIAAGERPSIEDAKQRLQWIEAYESSPIAFSFAKPFPPPPAEDVGYDGRILASQVNTSNGDAGVETRFHYRQKENTVWATYEGGRVRFGTLLAIPDTAGVLHMRYQHVNQEGHLRTGICWAAPELLPDGRVRLQECWQWTSGDESRGRSVVEEIGR